MNNQPAAYIDRQDLERLPHHDCWVNGQEHKNSVPLYTHPAKTLTDEEIDNVSDEVVPHIDTYAGRREFARLILKKASEK